MGIVRKLFYFLIDSIQTFLLAASFFLVVYIFLFRPFQVDGISMYPTFYNGEYILTNIVSLKLEKPKKGDVIVFQAPKDPNKDYIKRIIATQGDLVFLQNGQVYINGQKINESAYLAPEVQTFGGSFLKDGNAIIIPKNSYFVIGDNRAHSSDSREWGFVQDKDLIGKSYFVYFPFDRMRLVKNPFN